MSTGCNLMGEDVVCELQLAPVLLSLTQEDTDRRRCCRPLSEREIVKRHQTANEVFQTRAAKGTNADSVTVTLDIADKAFLLSLKYI